MTINTYEQGDIVATFWLQLQFLATTVEHDRSLVSLRSAAAAARGDTSFLAELRTANGEGRNTSRERNGTEAMSNAMENIDFHM